MVPCIFNDVEWSLTKIWRTRYYSTTNVSETVQDRNVITPHNNRNSHTPPGIISKDLSDLHYLNKISNDRNRRAVTVTTKLFCNHICFQLFHPSVFFAFNFFHWSTAPIFRPPPTGTLSWLGRPPKLGARPEYFNPAVVYSMSFCDRRVAMYPRSAHRSTTVANAACSVTYKLQVWCLDYLSLSLLLSLAAALPAASVASCVASICALLLALQAVSSTDRPGT